MARVYKMRVTNRDLKTKEEIVNGLLRNVSLRVEKRYNYIAIDICDKSGKVLETLIAGLTKKQTYNILDVVERILMLESKA